MTSKVVVITGASSGIGAALAQLLARRGTSVVLVARRKPELEAVATQCGPNALVVVADVGVRADVKRVVAQSLERFGRIIESRRPDVYTRAGARSRVLGYYETTGEDRRRSRFYESGLSLFAFSLARFLSILRSYS